MTEPGSVEVVARSSSTFYLVPASEEENKDDMTKVSKKSQNQTTD
jgi:hypothetical protein